MRDPHHDPQLHDDDDLMRELFPLDDGPGPAPRRSAPDLAAMVTAALDAHAPLPASAPAPTAPQHPSPAPLGLVLVATALTLGALTALWLATRVPVAAPASASDPDSAPDSASAGVAPTSAPAPAPGQSSALYPDSPAAAPEPQAGSDSASAGVAPASTPASATGPASDPRDLLREANALRGQGAFPAAERLYLRVVREHPRSGSAYVANVAAASLRLERLNNPRGALALYRTALRDNPSGSLAPEIRRGIAIAARRAGQPDTERRALVDFLAHHPGSPFAATARARLSELPAPIAR